MTRTAFKVIAIAVVEHADRYLIGKRPPGTPLEGLWEFPGGKVNTSEETPVAAAIRECLEETGIEITVEFAYPTVCHEYAHGTLELHFFHAHPRDASVSPADPFHWVTRAELSRLEFPPANQSVLERIGSAR